MANLENIKKQKQQEKNRHQRVMNSLNRQKADENNRYQRQIEYLNTQIERIKQQNQQLENYNINLDIALGM